MAEVEEILSFEDCSAVWPGKQKILMCNEDQTVFAGWLVWWARLALHLVSEVREDSYKMESEWQQAHGLHGKKGKKSSSNSWDEEGYQDANAKMLTTKDCLLKRQVSKFFNAIVYLLLRAGQMLTHFERTDQNSSVLCSNY